MITDPLFYLTAVPAVLIYGIGKGGLGGALGIIAVPLMALTTSPIEAAAILLPLLFFMDIIAIWHHAKNCDYQQLKVMLPPAVVGIAIAGYFLSVTPEYGLEILIGTLSVLFSLQYVTSNKPKRVPGKKQGYIWSLLSGFSSTTIHAGGGPISIYLLPQGLGKMQVIGTMAVLFGAMNFFKLIPYIWLGKMNATNLSTSLALLPIAPIGVMLGVCLLNRVSQEKLYQLCYFFLFISGIKLLWDGVQEMPVLF
ncbi:sulfite exporter TauE/SafE family protein [Photobacterium sp. ZSDE20]|uniref:Probable membrane transporter protein n=1 Tax=Photobacterium pectinilyticum TaxID=2906793 RepID=A0ABT1N8Y2_9GAMM|nr:sulfite exporter TauE/SafE family protein [Photobacterium sp. ZSDE20]MCQ1060299.1 sulfite exporter TauE/SafE family protein [Photobacterium sp. ZSDE20]MDD1827597.1 sulfite exporter TauE/SafE family protein [Photobacterium sp. ZSDE20]